MATNLHLLGSCNEAFAPTSRALAGLSQHLDALAGLADARTASRARALQARVSEFAPNVTLVGQVKAGKSKLANVLAGWPGLLPSDVNPWTSVVTTLSINARHEGVATGAASGKARFTFFSRAEWDNLIHGGGRLGELADRAGAEDEMGAIRVQIEAMREKTKARLGSHFELLLGQEHSYGYIDAELVERYVCMGDDIELQEPGSKTGRFADITKSAEFALDVPQYDFALKLCDTPGVNDTFMMREQITMRSLRGSELCVVVLSAHQALTTVDIALMRIIANLESRQIILFVNRVDELADPATQIDEIRSGIEQTLKSFNVATDVEIIFGSAMWGEAALVGDRALLSGDSLAALESYAAARPDLTQKDEWQTVWTLSGVPALLQAIGHRISEGAGKRFVEKVRRGALNLASEANATLAARRPGLPAPSLAMPEGNISPEAAMAALVRKYETEVADLCAGLGKDLAQRLDAAEIGFVKRATDSLIHFLGQYGEQGTWQYDPTGLRVLQRSAYLSFARSLTAKANALYANAANHVQSVYGLVTDGTSSVVRIEPPLTPQVPPPVSLGKTIALDLQSNWWRRWWQKRQGYEAYAKDYARLIQTETHSMTTELQEGQVSVVLGQIQAVLNDFLADHQETIRRISVSGADSSAQGHDAMPEMKPARDTTAAFGQILKSLNDMAA